MSRFLGESRVCLSRPAQVPVPCTRRASNRCQAAKAGLAMRSAALNNLYSAARRMLGSGSGNRSTSQVVEELRRLAEAVPLSELGFSDTYITSPEQYPRDLAAASSSSSSNSRQGIGGLLSPRSTHPFLRGEVTYLGIHEDEDFTLGIFTIPAGRSIPLHDHPGMTVISRLLFGSLRVQAYDFIGDDELHAQAMGTAAQAFLGSNNGSPAQQNVQHQPTNVGSRPRSALSRLWPLGGDAADDSRDAVVRLDTSITAPCQPLVLWPYSCNVHEFTAETPCAILDLLTPPYAADLGRDCTYYEVAGKGGSRRGSQDRTRRWSLEGSDMSTQQRQKQDPVGSLVSLQKVDASWFNVANAPYTGMVPVGEQ